MMKNQERKEKKRMAEVNFDELKAIIGDREVVSPFGDILVTDIMGMGAKEHDAYVKMVQDRAGKKKVTAIAALRDDEEHVTIHYVCAEPRKFERIRRITGYLVGTIDRWNDAKRAEEHDRVKHSMD